MRKVGLYMVRIEPKAGYRSSYCIPVKIVLAWSMADALRNHGMDYDKKYYYKPFAVLLELGKEYRL